LITIPNLIQGDLTDGIRVGEGLEPCFSGVGGGVAEVRREPAGAAFEFFEEALYSVPISMCDVWKSAF
jgi:hypothetical protein